MNYKILEILEYGWVKGQFVQFIVLVMGWVELVKFEF